MHAMAGQTGTALLFSDHMAIMEIVRAVTKTRLIFYRLGGKQLFIMALKAEVIFISLIRGIKGPGEGTGQQHGEITAMNIMTGTAFSFGNRTVHHLFTLYLLADVEGGIGAARIILAMAGETEISPFFYKQGRILGKVGKMTVAASLPDIKGLMLVQGGIIFVFDILVAAEAEIDTVAFQQAGLVAAVGHMAGAAVKLADGGMQVGCLLHARREILVTIKAQFFQRHFKQTFLIGTMRVMARGTGTGGRRAMFQLAVEPLLIMTLKTEVAALCRYGKVLPRRRRMLRVHLLVAGQAVIPVNRGMDKLLHLHFSMTAVCQTVIGPAVMYRRKEQNRKNYQDGKKQREKAISPIGRVIAMR